MPNNHYHPVKYALVLCFLLCACAPAQQTIIPATPTTSPTVEATPTIISTPTLEGQGLKDLVYAPCLSVNPEPPEGNQIPWLLLVQRAAVYALDPNTGERTEELIPAPDPNSPLVYDFSLSPDGKWLAYYELPDENDDSVVVEPSDNLLTKSSHGRIIFRPEKPFRLQGWLNNESIVLTIQRNPDRFVSTLIRNPFQEEEHEFFLEELPDYLDHQLGGLAGSMLFAHSNLMPDPTLKRVVYQTKNDRLMATLWDVENKKVVTSLRLFYDWAFFNDPLWSLDGSDFIIMGIDEKEHEEWFQVTRDGTIQQLTHFREFLTNTSFGESSRSPDGRYLGFRLYKEDGTYQNSRYLILDLKSPSLDGFCIDLRGKSNPDKPIAWSPDSKYVVITNGTVGDRSAEVILVDLEKQKAFQIAIDVEAIGWMLKP
jgi:WD40 repeat protein